MSQQVELLEQISKVSLFNEEQAIILWQQLLKTINVDFLPEDEHKNIRELFSSDKKFADCTAISK